MIPLHHEPHFTFQFVDARKIPRFHLDGLEFGRPVTLFRLTRDAHGRRIKLADAIVGTDSWVELTDPLIVAAGDGFIAVPRPEVIVREELPADQEPIRNVNIFAFGGNAEADLVDQLRASGFAQLSLVAEVNGQIMGHLMFSDLSIVSDQAAVPALALAPMAVRPEVQSLGVGTALIRRGLDLCRQRGHRIVIVLGHRDYYPRFGFSAELARPLASPFAGDSFMAMELTPGSMVGVRGQVVYAPPFNAF